MIEQGYNQITISEAVHTKWAGKTVHFARQTDSTNLWAKALAREGAPHGTLAVTEYQSAGRGRFERRWTAPEGSSVMMTLVLRPDFSPVYGSMLTLVMGLAVAQAVQTLGFEVSIKWPNDVVVSGKKICGILTEMGVAGDKIGYVVIGVGINVNTKEIPKDLQDKATSLYREGGQLCDRNQVIGLVMQHFEDNYQRFVKTCSLSQLLPEYHELLANREKPVRVLDPKAPFEGIARGINEKGELLVEKQDGELVQVSAGEVSVRGLYTYV